MYQEILPKNNTIQYLESIWFSNSDKKFQNILPDNCSDIIINLNQSKNVRFVGNMTKNMIHKPVEDELLLGMRFKPAYSAAFIRENMTVLTDKVVDLSIVFEHSLDQVAEVYQETGKVPLDFIMDNIAKFCSNYTLDSHVAESMDILKNSFGGISIMEVASTLGISRRMLEKKFKRFLGKTPKRFAQIERINGILSGEIKFQNSSYYDQSHMIKEFNMLTESHMAII